VRLEDMDDLRLTWSWPLAEVGGTEGVLELAGKSVRLDERLAIMLTDSQAEGVWALLRESEPWRFPERAFCGVGTGRLEIVGPHGASTCELRDDVEEEIESPFWLGFRFAAVDTVVGVLNSLAHVLLNLSARISEDVERAGRSTRAWSEHWRPNLAKVPRDKDWTHPDRLVLRLRQFDSWRTITWMWFVTGRTVRQQDGKVERDWHADPGRVFAAIREMREELGLVGNCWGQEDVVARRGSRVVTYAYGGSCLQWEASPHIETEMGVQVDRHIFPGLSDEEERALELLSRLGA
jgi:hypothetical protein